MTYIGEERYLHSLVHFAKDPQRLYNYWKSTEAQILQKNQDDILVVDPKGVSGHEEEWRDPSKFAAVHYKHSDDSQQSIPAPYRIGAAQPPVGVLNAAESAKVAITDILNMHAPIMGGDSQEVSGVAIGMRQRQSETAQFHLQDNLEEEQPIEPAQSIQNPDQYQGFLMPEQNAQPLALNPDQVGESAMINEGNLLPQMEQDNGSEQF
ncbi:portal protein [Acinetobacter seifertii]|uniref:portal protein n=1 Tax=Acinetobacter seifertii TaxID=1530123 RepID=UPI00208EA5D5|nr:hypothetical protein [Acinetobacter seifertii]